MLDFEEYKELRNGKRYYTCTEHILNDNGCIEENVTRNSSEHVEGENPETQTLTQKVVNEQIRRFNAPLTHQLEELTRMVQETVTTQHTDH